MSVWFEGRIEVKCTLDEVRHAFENLGEHYAGVVAQMPGLANVELAEQGSDSLTITTSEGRMERRTIVTTIEPDRIVLSFDEEYHAGSRLTVHSQFTEQFTPSGSGSVDYRLVMRDVQASGLLGFFYRRFGSSKIGNALLAAQKARLEKRSV